MARPINILTPRKVSALKEVGRHSDGGGLYLRITPAGAKSWVFITTTDRKRSEIGLGAASVVSLAAARYIAGEMRDAVAKRQDPRAVIAPAPPPAEEPEVLTFGEFADEFVAGLIDGWKHPKHRDQWVSSLKNHAAPLRPKSVDAINTDDVLAVLRPIWTKTPEAASKLRGRIERILDAAVAAGKRDPDKRNPATWHRHLEHFLPRHKRTDKEHHAAVSWRDMPAFWSMLSQRKISSSAAALRFTILNATRTSETIGARRREFDLDAKKWTIPKERMKLAVAHEIPLTNLAIDVLHDMGINTLKPDDYVFPGGNKDQSLSNMAMLMLLQGDLKTPATVHGFRSTFRDWAGDATDHSRELAEMALAHAVADAVERAYRRGTAFEKRRVLMEDWAAYLTSEKASSAQPPKPKKVCKANPRQMGIFD